LHPGCTFELWGDEVRAFVPLEDSYPKTWGPPEFYDFNYTLLQTNTNTSSSPITYSLLSNNYLAELGASAYIGEPEGFSEGQIVHWYNVYAITYRLYFA
jgi:hypothetical protein